MLNASLNKTFLLSSQVMILYEHKKKILYLNCILYEYRFIIMKFL